MHAYNCTNCSKKGEVAFRLNSRNPEKITRATEDTPKPLCLLCAEKKREEIRNEKRLAKLKPAESEPNKDKTNTEPVVKESEPKPVLGTKDVKVIWRWAAYGSSWTQKRPVEDGDYWIWATGDEKPVLRKIVAGSYSTMQPFLNTPGLWYLGPAKVPPTPLEAVGQAKNLKKKREKDDQPKDELEVVSVSNPVLDLRGDDGN